MYESPEPLTTFFSQLIPAARSAGYKLVVTLLAREADSEEIFRDVERYWSSLHDVTGEHILFVLGAHRAASKFPHTGMREHRAPVAHMNAHAAIAGSRTVYWPSSSSNIRHSLWSGHETASEKLAHSHTMEIAGLRDMFSLPENSIPALLFFTLESDRYSPKPIVVSLSTLGRHTIYGFLKKLIGDFEEQFIIIKDQRATQADLNHQLEKLVRNGRKWLGWGLSLEPVSTKAEAKEATAQILAICRSSDKQYAEKRRCFDLLKLVTKEIGSHAQLTIDLQRLIDHAFGHHDPQGMTYLNRKEELLSRIDEVKRREELAWQKIHAQLRMLQIRPDIITNHSTSRWDYFIAYSSKDQWYADRLYASLSKNGSVFLDRLCLRPGDVWPRRLRAEQDRSRCTVVLLTKNTDDAWFANSEYIHAIELARHGAHRVVPILIGKDAKIPYGLEQIHAVRNDGGGDFASIATLLAETMISQ